MQLQPAFVLHSRPWRETSLLVELLTLDGGRVGTVARGVRRANSKRKGLVQPFLPLLVSCKGRGELKTLASLEAVSAPFTLKGEHLYCGLYLNELLMRLLAREISFTGLFGRYRSLLIDLSCGEAAEPLLRRFELDLLKQLGVLPSLQHTGAGTSITPSHEYCLLPEQGFCPAPASGRGQHYKGELLLLLGSSESIPESLWPLAKRLTRELLKPLLGARPLHSRSLFQRAQPAYIKGENR